MYESFQNKVLKTIEKYKMLDDINCVIVGVSGGADSVTLLNILHFITDKKIKHFKIFVIHVNHMLRGDEAFRDEKFVTDLCNDLKIDYHVERVDVKAIAKQEKIGLEECGRNVRYEIFNKFAQKFEETGLTVKIALAHNLNDNIETIFMNMARGCGLHGICGIFPVRDRIIRPLIEISRNEIEKHCCEKNIKFVNDSSNFYDIYTRNKIRNHLIPEIKKIFPNFENKILDLIKKLNQDNFFLEKYAETVFENSKIFHQNSLIGFDINKIKNEDLSIQNRIIIKIFKHFKIKNISKIHIKSFHEITKNNKKKFSLPNNFFVENHNNIIHISKKINKLTKSWQINLFDLINSKSCLTHLKQFAKIKSVYVKEIKNFKFDKNLHFNLIDFEKLPKNCVIRNRRPGDRFKPKNRNVTKLLRKFFNEIKIPKKLRDNLPVIASGNDVLWIYGVGTNESTKINLNTTKFLVIEGESLT